MDKIKKTLWSDYDKVSNQIDGVTDVNNEKYKLLLEERDKVRNELIKLEQTKIEADLKKQQLETEVKNKEAQIKADDQREAVRNKITIGTFLVTTGISVYAIIRTFKFDETGTVTSTLGRNILTSAMPKMFKR